MTYTGAKAESHYDNSHVYLMDCMDALRQTPDKYYDLAVVDPPYGIGFDNKIRDKKVKNWDRNIPSDEYFNELQRVSKNQIIWGANYFPFLWNKGCKGFIFWHKDSNFDSYSDGELAYTSFDKPARCFYWAWNGLADGIKGRNKKEVTIHPTQKPVALYDWIYHNYLPNGGKVIDTHLGSGSNRIAADKAGNIEFYGFEIDCDYYEAQEKRYKIFKMQTRLF